MLKISITSVPVEDQEKALDFYTNVLVLLKKSKFLWESTSGLLLFLL